MWQEVFNPQNYQWNPWSAPMFAGAILLFSTGFFIWLKKKDLFGFIYCLWTGSAAIGWLLITGFIFMAKTNEVAFFLYNKIGFLGIAFISVHGYFLSLLWRREYSKQQNKILVAGYLIMAIFAVSNFLYNTVCTGMYEYFWGKYPKYSLSFGLMYLPFWFAFFLATTINYYREYIISSGIKKKQSGIVLSGLVIIYFGAVDYIPTFGFEIYPFGYIPVVLFFSIMFYVIIRYRAFDIDTVIHRTALWLATSLWLVLPAYVLFSFTHAWFKTLSPFWITIVALGLFYLFLWYYRYFQPRIDHLFRRRKYDYYEVLGELGQKIGSELELEKVQSRLFKELKDILYIRNGVLLMRQTEAVEDYREIGVLNTEKSIEQEKVDAPLYLSFTSTFSQWLNREQKVVEREEIEANPKYQEIKEECLNWMKQKEIEVVIPIVAEEKVKGILGIGKKENLQAYTNKDLELLEKMGRQIGITIDNALHHGDIVEKERLAEELRLGQEIQLNLLPRAAPEIPGLKLSGMMIPAKEIGGDYYDYIVSSSKIVGSSQDHQTAKLQTRVSVVIGDVSGKGVAAGLIMATAKATLKGLSQQGLTPKEMLTQTNSIIHEYTKGEKFMTMLYFQWDSEQKKMSYSSAGHEHILIYRNNGKLVAESWKLKAESEGKEALNLQHSASSIQQSSVEVIPSGGFMLGMMPEIGEMLENRELELVSGDKVVVYTDGVTEARNQIDEMYSLDRLTKTLKEHGLKPCQELIASLKDNVYAFIGGAEQFDDITLVVMEIE